MMMILKKLWSGLRALIISASKSRRTHSIIFTSVISFPSRDAAIIKGYPRNLPSLVRREDTSRKDARERKKQRKEEELARKREEVKRLKGLKMKELKAKLERIGREGGKNLDETKGGILFRSDNAHLMPIVICSCVVALQDLDLEGDWDPESHDRQMASLYGENEVDVDDKPQWDDDIDIGDIVYEEAEIMSNKKQKKKNRKKGKEPDEEDAGVDVDAMDADVERLDDDEEWDGTEEMRKRKLDEYMDEIYGLDFNDMASRFELCHMKAMLTSYRLEICLLGSNTRLCNLNRSP
jgi:protein KRI1